MSLLLHPALHLGSLPSNPILLRAPGACGHVTPHIFIWLRSFSVLSFQVNHHLIRKPPLTFSTTNILSLLQKELRELKNNFSEDQTKPEQTKKHLSLSFSSITASPELTTSLQLHPRSAEALPWSVYQNRLKVENSRMEEGIQEDRLTVQGVKIVSTAVARDAMTPEAGGDVCPKPGCICVSSDPCNAVCPLSWKPEVAIRYGRWLFCVSDGYTQHGYEGFEASSWTWERESIFFPQKGKLFQHCRFIFKIVYFYF